MADIGTYLDRKYERFPFQVDLYLALLESFRFVLGNRSQLSEESGIRESVPVEHAENGVEKEKRTVCKQI